MAPASLPLQVITPDMARASVQRAKASLEAAAREIVWQVEREVWVTLGYRSWREMREAEYGGAAFMLPRAERPEIVGQLRALGLPKAEIAATAGVGRPTIDRDLNAQTGNEPPTITNARGQQRPATYAPRITPPPDDDEIVDAEIVEDPEPATIPRHEIEAALAAEAAKVEQGVRLRQCMEAVDTLAGFDPSEMSDEFIYNGRNIDAILAAHRNLTNIIQQSTFIQQRIGKRATRADSAVEAA